MPYGSHQTIDDADRTTPPDYAAAEYISPTGLKKLGWKDPAIRQVLGEPDLLAKNPKYATAAPTRLHDVVRVAELEATLANTVPNPRPSEPYGPQPPSSPPDGRNRRRCSIWWPRATPP